MEVTKTAPIDATAPIDSAPARDQPAAAPRPEGDPIAAARPPVDRIDIHPLDIPAAMQILIAEIRAGLDLPAVAAAAGPAGWNGMPGAGGAVPGPMQAARLSIQLFLEALPGQGDDPAADAVALAGIDLKFQSAMQRAVDAIDKWPDVPRAVMDAAGQARTYAMAQMAEDTLPNPLWLRPEWLGLAPRMQALRHRRRRARGLSDPDLGPVRDEEALPPADAERRPREEPP